jgi:dTDP-4-amino-4,6-dideoxygalactose transaminase
MKIGKPSITNIEKRFLYTAIENGDISQGDHISQFEKEWAHMNDREFGVSCNSGTSAIKLALQAFNIGDFDEVLVPEFTMTACAFSVSSLGASPVFVDCLDDLTMDVSKIKVNENTKAILIVPIYGRPVSDEVYKLARKHGLKVIEDFAEAHGIKPKGDITCYSFQANKIITTGEGGMCITNNGLLANEMRKLSSLYFDEKRTMIHNRIAQNYRMTNLQSAIGLGQIRRFEELKNKRIKIAGWYDEYLPKELKMPKREVVWVYDIQTDDQEKLKSFLADKGIETRYGFKPMSEQPPYQYPGEQWKKLNAYKWSRRVLYLPTYFSMTFTDVKNVCQKIQQFLDTK